MRTILAIAKKELGIFFTTPVAYAVLCGLTFIASYFFLAFIQNFVQTSLLAQQMPQMVDPARLNLTDAVATPLVFNCAVIFIFVLPFLSMRLIAEEKRQRTFELLMTTPVRPIEVVLGKYLGGLGVVALSVAALFIYPLVLNHYGAASSTDGSTSSAVEWATVVTAHLGLLLWGASGMAVGLFVSALTESQVVAALVTFAALLMSWIAGWVAQSAESPVVKELFNQLSASSHLTGFVRGDLALADITYFLSVIVLCLFLTQRAVESERWS